MSMQFASLLLVSVAVAGICALFYAIDSRGMFGGRYVNAWLTASLLAVLCTVSYLAAARLGQPVWLIALANTAMAAAVAAVWVGCRAFNARSLALPIVVPVLAIVAVGATLPDPDGAQWAGTGVKILALSAFSALTVVEACRGRLRTFHASWVLLTAHAVHAAYSAARFVAYVSGGIDGALFSTFFNTMITTVVNMGFVLLTTLALVLLRLSEVRAKREQLRGEPSLTRRSLRARRRAHPGATLLTMDIEDLDVIKAAYGPEHVDELIDQLVTSALHVIPQPLGINIRRSGTVLMLLHPEHSSPPERLGQLIAREYRDRSAKLVEGYAQVIRVSSDHPDSAHDR